MSAFTAGLKSPFLRCAHWFDPARFARYTGLRFSQPTPAMTTQIEDNANTNTAAVEQPVWICPHISKLRPYVPGKPIEEVQRELGLPDELEIFKLASNENVLGPSPLAIEAMQKAAGGVWLYPDDTCFALKNALAEFWNLSPEHFILGNGSDEIIHFLGLAFLDAQIGDEAIIADPSFVQYLSLIHI